MKAVSLAFAASQPVKAFTSSSRDPLNGTFGHTCRISSETELIARQSWAARLTAVRVIRGFRLAITVALFLSAYGLHAQQLVSHYEIAVANGWHPWYEVKSDPDDVNSLIVCGSAWDAAQNSLFGFVYSSSDAGRTWGKALEDRNSLWVTEQSCAFGPRHTAYFISEASKVIDGKTHHDQGITRLFVSADGGRHWKETVQTAWADFSTSAADPASGSLFTFFNYGDTADRAQAHQWGSSVGVLVFSPDGTRVSGPFTDPVMKTRGYHGNYPSESLALGDAIVVALYTGTRDTAEGPVMDLGMMRVEASGSPSPTSSVIASSVPASRRGCLGDHALAYDRSRDRLAVVYQEDDGDTCRAMLTTSIDGGRVWTGGLPITGLRGETFNMAEVSAVAGSNGSFVLLWSAEGRWFISSLKETALAGPPLDLHGSHASRGVLDDALMTTFPTGGPDLVPATTLRVRTYAGEVWRGRSLTSSGKRLYAVVPVVESGSEKLDVIAFSTEAVSLDAMRASEPGRPDRDVSGQVSLLYGSQNFDTKTGMLTLGVRLANRSDRNLAGPIRLEVTRIGSGIGKIDILNADNHLSGAGAIWDLSRCLVGDQLPTGATTLTTCTLRFHVEVEPIRLGSTSDLLSLTGRIFAH